MSRRTWVPLERPVKYRPKQGGLGITVHSQAHNEDVTWDLYRVRDDDGRHWQITGQTLRDYERVADDDD